VRSIRNRLALVFGAIALVALAGSYLYVVPRLESRLLNEKLRSLATASIVYSEPLAHALSSDADQRQINRLVREAADRAGARVTLLGLSRGTEGLRPYPITDSTSAANIPQTTFPTAVKAAQLARLVTGEEPTNQGRIGEAARPLLRKGRVARVVVYSQPLADVQRNVALIRRQIAVAAFLAFLFAAAVGYIVANALSRRIKRLEAAARAVAGGDFSQKIPIESDDELGQLAAAFNDMQQQLAELDSARKRFIATASHELRTPIFSLGGFVELLADEQLDDDVRREFLEQMAGQVARLRKLSVDLLDLSRLEAGSLDLRPERTDVRMLARTVASEFTPALVRHDSVLKLQVPRAAVMATCDPERVAQILRILIDNALTHTPTGTGLGLAAERANGSVRLTVRDEGLGISDRMAARVFEPFFTSDDAQGSGLGLAIAHELAERMEGRLTVTSKPGETTFTLELPAQRPGAARSVSSPPS
jgi:signal transduction histidine kinase